MSDPDVVELISAATRDCVVALLQEPAIVNSLVEARIRQLIDAGDLVPREQLRMGTALELGPAGLTQAARAVVTAANRLTTKSPKLKSAVEVLKQTLDATTPTVDKKRKATKTPTKEPTVEDELEPPAEQQPRCAVCDTDKIDAEQALLSHSRWRLVLCSEHHGGMTSTRARELAKQKAEATS